MRRRIVALLTALLLLCGLLAGCGAEKEGAAAAEAEVKAEAASEAKVEAEARSETVIFTDDCGRTVELPAEVTRVAPSGSVATMFLASIAPDYMVSVSGAPDENQRDILPQTLFTLPETGQMYGSKATLNLETLLACNAQLVIDIGDLKKNMAEDLDALQAQIGIPVVFLEGDLKHMEHAFRTLGALLSERTERGNALADFVSETLAASEQCAAQVREDERLRVMYTSGTTGLDTNADGSTQAQVLGLVGAQNAIVVPDVKNKSGGNPINMEQLYQFTPDVILFAPGSIASSVENDPAWQQLEAIRTRRYCEIPSVPYNWLSNPPSLNMLLGIWWLSDLLYPQYTDYDITKKLQEEFSVLWSRELTQAEAQEILANAAFPVVK